MSSRRLASIDALRGLAIALMILVNNTGSWEHTLPQLLHAEWHGWTITDLVFPLFLFISGISLVFSLGSRLERGDSRGRIVAKILRRGLILFGLGLFLDLFPLFHFSNLRIPGVLQRIAVCYVAAALLHLKLKKRGLIIACALLLLGYWLVMVLVPVPGQGTGHGAGNLTPEGNLAAWLDGIVFKGTRLYRGTWDPEGVLSTFPAIATILLGVLCGTYLSGKSTWPRKAAVLLAWGAAGIGAGLLWNIIFPINKNLWTSSYVLFAAGWALLALSPLLYLCEHKGWRSWLSPLVVLGVNPITAYVLSSMLDKALRTIRLQAGMLHDWLYQNLFASWAGLVPGSLLFALTVVLLWTAVMYLFYRKKMIIRI